MTYLSVDLSAQKGVELGGWVGLSHYYGDLQTELTISDPGLAGGLILRYNLDDRICLKSSVNYARISASDSDSQNTFERRRNLDFSSDIWDVTGQIEFNFLSYIHGSKDHFFTPYLLAGISLFSYNPETKFNDQTFRLRDFGTEGQAVGEEYGLLAIAPTIGIGLKWDVNFDWSFNIELSIHGSSSDYLDDVSTTYPDFSVLSATRGQQAVALSDRSIGDGIGTVGRQRGNSRNNDTYVLLGFGVLRYFGTLACPKVSRKRKIKL
jgi:hypothetical protein